MRAQVLQDKDIKYLDNILLNDGTGMCEPPVNNINEKL